MKELSKKLCLLMIITSLVVPSTFVYAEGENEGGTGTNTEEKEKEKENETEKEKEKEEETTPEKTPEVTPEKTPEETVKSENATLASLTVNGESITLKEGVTTYEHVVKKDVSKADIKAKAAGKASIDSSKSNLGNNDLKIGSDNSFDIVVVAESGKEVTYKLKITRASSDMTLKSLTIKGLKLNEVFAPDTYEYTSDVTYNVTSITVVASANSGKVSVTGNNNLKVGKNTVKVTVKNEAGESQDYTIIVTRGTEEDLEKVDSAIDSTSSVELSEDTSKEVVAATNNKDDDDKDDHTLRNVIIVTSSVLLVLIASLGIYFYVKTGDKERKRQKKIEKLKKKQAKIEEQLTGLMPVITEEQEEEYLNNKEEDIEDEEIEVEEEENDTMEDTIEINPDTIYESRRFEYTEYRSYEDDDDEEEETPRRKRVDKVIEEVNLDDLFEDGDE